MTPEEFSSAIERLRIQGSDDAQIEVKECRAALSTDVWESVSAFANTQGGYILLGVSERDGFKPVKGFALEKVLGQFVSGMGDAGSGARMANPPRYLVERHVLEGAAVLGFAIRPLELTLRPCYIIDKGVSAGSYKRVDDRDIRLSPTEVYSMLNVMTPSDADTAAVNGSSIADFDDRLTTSLVSQAAYASPKALRGADDLEAQLTRLNAMKADGTTTLAGLLACGRYPQQFFPRAVVDVAAHAGTGKALPGNPRFLDRVVCEGPIGEVIDDAVHAIMKNLRVVSVVEGTGRVDSPEVPAEVLREAIANAVIHREYDAPFLGQGVQVDIFTDRVEIASPGGLWGGKTLENLDDGRSRCRNAALMRLAMLLQPPGGSGRAAEGGGTGVGMMKRVMDAAGLPAPVFIAEPDCFTVRFSRLDAFGASVDARTRGRRRVSRHDVLSALSETESQSMRELAELLGSSPDAMRYHLRKLIEEGLVVATADSTDRNRRYLKVASR